MTISELNEEIRALAHRIWAIESTVCGPGERGRLLEELAETRNRKSALTTQRDKLISQRNAQNVATQFGSFGLTNETRGKEEIRADIKAKNQRQKERAWEELQSLSGALATFTYEEKI